MPQIRSDVSPDPTTPASPRSGSLILKLVSFCYVGGVGFIVDVLCTLTMMNFGLGPYLARAAAVTVALFTTYTLNRGLTFRREAGVGAKAVAGETARYFAVGVTTSLLNWAVYAGVIALVPAVPTLAAIVIGSAMAMVASYLGFSRLVFRG